MPVSVIGMEPELMMQVGVRVQESCYLSELVICPLWTKSTWRHLSTAGDMKPFQVDLSKHVHWICRVVNSLFWLDSSSVIQYLHTEV